MYSEFELKRQIEKIANGDDSPIRKARRLLTLSHHIGRFSTRLGRRAFILQEDVEEGADRMMDTAEGLMRLEQEARLAAYTALNVAKPKSLSFEVRSEATAYPIQWMDTKERLDDRLGYN